MVRRIVRYRGRGNRMQNGAGFFDILKKGVKFLGSKKARKILDIGRKGLEWAGKAQKGIAGFTGQNGAGMHMRGDHPITKAQARKLLTLLKNGGRRSTRTRRTRRRGRAITNGCRGRRRGQRGGGGQRGGFFSWIFKKIVDAIA